MEYKPKLEKTSPVAAGNNTDLRESGVVLEDRSLMGSLSERQSITGLERKKKVHMHVNQFVPFFMQYHAVSSQQLDDFHADYAKQTMIKPQLKDFDLKLLEIFNNRRTRYISRFYSDGESFDDFEEGQHDQETSKANAESFQQSDLQELRELFKSVCNGYIQQLEAADDKFTEEREFFLRQSEKDK